jgi:hypothetical protein
MGKNKGPDIPQQSLKVDIDKILKRFRKDIVPEFNRWQERRPELQQLTDFTQGTMIPGLTRLLNQIPNVNQAINPLQQLLTSMPNVNRTIAPLQRILGALPNANQFAQPIQQVSQQLQQRMGNLMNVAPTLQATFADQLAPILRSGGMLTRDQQAAAQREALGTYALQGNAFGNQAALADIMNQQKYRDQRLQGAIQNTAGLEGIQGQDVAARLGLGQGITQAQQARQGVYGTDAQIRAGLVQGMDALRSSDMQRRLGLTSGIQNIRGTDIAQRLGLMQGITGAIEQPLQFGLQTFNSLMNPLMGFAGNVFDSNQNAAAAQNIAGANKSAGLTSGILSSLGAVGGGVAIAV